MNETSISVLIATYNRAGILRRTLDHFLELDLDGMAIEFVIIDNNSNDDSRETVESYRDKLPLRYLFESRPGKNSALNKAINEIDLGELVVFTDDDVKPHPDWLLRIREISNRWEDIDVFGGPIYPIWPDGDQPDWIPDDKAFLSFAFAWHDRGKEEILYEGNFTPFGANYWVRNKIFLNGYKFDENIGPVPDDRKRIMGSEGSFLMMLKENGYDILYSPLAVVGHCLTEDQLTKGYLAKRARTSGRSAVLFSGFKYPRCYRRWPLAWYCLRAFSLVKHQLRLMLSYFRRDKRHKMKIFIDAKRWISFNVYYMRNAEAVFSLHTNQQRADKPQPKKI